MMLFDLFISSIVRANEQAVAHAAGIPKVVYYQALNLGILVIVLIYFLRDKIKAFFAQRGHDFHQAVEKAHAVKHEAESKHKDIKERLQQLSDSAAENIARAHAEAEQLKQLM